MASQRQIDANRRNSQLSTGPRTPEGKAASRFNALKSGVNAKAQVLPGEDPAELEAMTAGYHRDWAPTTWLERFLVDSLIRADWLLQRLSRIEAELWAFRMEEARQSTYDQLSENAPLGHMYYRLYDPLARLQRRIDSTERSYYRALTQLQRLRSGNPLEPEFLPSEPLPSEPPAATPPEPEQPAASLPPAAAKLASFCRATTHSTTPDIPQSPGLVFTYPSELSHVRTRITLSRGNACGIEKAGTRLPTALAANVQSTC